MNSTQAPALLAHTTDFMQQAFFVQGLIAGVQQANHTALSLAAITSHRNRILVSHFFDGRSRMSNAMEIWGRLFDRFQDIPSLRDMTLKSCATENPADAILDAAATILIGALQAVHHDRWIDSIAHLPFKTYLSLSLALESAGEAASARELIKRASKIGYRFGAWQPGLEGVAKKLEELGETELAADVHRDLSARQERDGLPSILGFGPLPAPLETDNGFRWRGLLGDIAAAHPDINFRGRCSPRKLTSARS